MQPGTRKRVRRLERRVAALEAALPRSLASADPEYVFQTIVIDFDRRTVTRDHRVIEATTPVVTIPVLRPGAR